jgi:hypothetical protein
VIRSFNTTIRDERLKREYDVMIVWRRYVDERGHVRVEEESIGVEMMRVFLGDLSHINVDWPIVYLIGDYDKTYAWFRGHYAAEIATAICNEADRVKDETEVATG